MVRRATTKLAQATDDHRGQSSSAAVPSAADGGPRSKLLHSSQYVESGMGQLMRVRNVAACCMWLLRLAYDQHSLTNRRTNAGTASKSTCLGESPCRKMVAGASLVHLLTMNQRYACASRPTFGSEIHSTLLPPLPPPTPPPPTTTPPTPPSSFSSGIRRHFSKMVTRNPY